MSDMSMINDFLKHKTMAIAGVSRSGKKFGSIILKTLTQKGYRLTPVHPEAKTINDVDCVPSINALPEDVENLILVIPPAKTDQMVRLMPASGIKRVWMQQGAESPAAIDFCKNNNIDVISGECILMYAQPTGLHKFHHWLRGVFGRHPD